MVVVGQRRRAYHPKARSRRQSAARRTGRSAAPWGKTRIRTLICGGIFISLIALKLLLPGNLAALRGTLRSWLVRDADFTEAFSAVGRAVSGEETLGASVEQAYRAVFGIQDDAVAVSAPYPETGETADFLLSRRALPEHAAAEQRVLNFAYTAPLSGSVTSPFGWRIAPDSGAEAFHYGIDLAGEEGAPIACFADGTVDIVGESTLLGNYLTVRHEGDFSTLYAHCSKITAQPGQQVRRGESIALVGSTGNATGNHLHFELHEGGEYLNPIYYVAQ